MMWVVLSDFQEFQKLIQRFMKASGLEKSKCTQVWHGSVYTVDVRNKETEKLNNNIPG